MVQLTNPHPTPHTCASGDSTRFVLIRLKFVKFAYYIKSGLLTNNQNCFLQEIP